MKKFIWNNWLLALMLSFILVLAGCGNNNQTAPSKDNAPASEVKKEKDQSYSVTDDLGDKITFDKVPEKVISLQPSNTEILFALGAGEKVVGVTDVDNYPKEAADIESVSDSMNINAEKIIALNPDVIIAYTIGDETTLQPLRDAGIPIFVIASAATFEDVYGDIQQIAEVMGVKENGNVIVDTIKNQIAAVVEKTDSINEKKRVYLEISPAPEIYTPGKKTFQQEILANAGVTNIFEDQEGWIKVSEEEIIKRNPDVITTTAGFIENPEQEIKSRTGWDQLTSVKEDKVYYLNEDLMSRPGPRIGEAVELVAKTVYPDLFK
ncbi:ABC transporter substrate-binding protein [Peribacillus loiseleuriae]|uniref:Metal ABC transporter substrate-binding protein n=1 Tax=Peribacillus loiseleuriae TaxID=1679170 RepID=A0A0K9GNY6_9BACI|nr:ABC transporter substrate-binding protein [Peribacillus loiseleuriae]KMY48370.1 metal ABC transporter substrate-binding protein [Peribacillus loiseleuriae]